MFPQRLEQERSTGARLMQLNPQSWFEILPGVDHAGVWAHASRCFDRILPHRR